MQKKCLTKRPALCIINHVAEVSTPKQFGSIAQLGEHLPYKQEVTGSSPVVPTTISGPVVQSVSTPACHAGGRRFESVPGRQKRGTILWMVPLFWQIGTDSKESIKLSGGQFGSGQGPAATLRAAWQPATSPFRVAFPPAGGLFSSQSASPTAPPAGEPWRDGLPHQ